MSQFKTGDRVQKNPDHWVKSEFDAWGAGEGVGVVVDVIEESGGGSDTIDVRWPTGRAYQRPEELTLAEEPREDTR